ncbi:MAG: HAD family acid phosphatase [Proteobacteria bacterium]|nr:HAD family acid phosphatase [Pseudomonadota bacterium]
MQSIKLSRIWPLVLGLSCSSFLTTSFAEPTNLHTIKQELETYHDSGCYEKELAAVISQATNYILKEADANKTNLHKKKLAIVLDIDETSLSNYPYMVKRSFGGTREEMHREIEEAKAMPIAPTLALYESALKAGVTVFFVTGRYESERNATKINLENAGFKNWAGLYLRPLNYKHKTSIIPFKVNAREQITRKGYTIIASIGDQYSDIKGGFAKKGFKLPNPYYYLP